MVWWKTICLIWNYFGSNYLESHDVVLYLMISLKFFLCMGPLFFVSCCAWLQFLVVAVACIAGCLASLLGENRDDAMGKSVFDCQQIDLSFFVAVSAMYIFSPRCWYTIGEHPHRRPPYWNFRKPFRMRPLFYACDSVHWSNGHWLALLTRQLINYEINNKAVIRARTRFIVGMHKIRIRTSQIHSPLTHPSAASAR